MTTFLAQNQFISNSTVIQPPTVDSTADSACRLQNVVRPDATAERDPHLICEPTSSTGGRQETPAAAHTKNPDVGVLADRIDWHEFFDAVMDERVVLFELYDEVPLFIRSGDHLRRWEA